MSFQTSFFEDNIFSNPAFTDYVVSGNFFFEDYIFSKSVFSDDVFSDSVFNKIDFVQNFIFQQERNNFEQLILFRISYWKRKEKF